jgi:hypothetical protein
MVVEKEGDEKPGKESEFEGNKERHKLEGGGDIGETPRWKVISGHQRQPTNDAICVRGRAGVDQHEPVGQNRANISERVQRRSPYVRESDEQ